MNEMTFGIQWLIGLCYMVVIFFIRCHIYNFVCNDRILRIIMINLTVWCFYKSILVNSCITCKGVDKTDVRSFRRLNRTHSSVVRVVYVSNLESCTISWQTTRTKSRQTSLMCQLTKRVVLIHELWQLGRTKEFFYRCCHWFDIDQRLWRNSFQILCGHSLTYYTL